MNRRTVIAEIFLLRPEDGGRSQSILKGYRSLLRFTGTTTDFGFEIDFEPAKDATEFLPGTTRLCRLSFWAVDLLPILSQEAKFEVREGSRIIGNGKIVNLKAV